MAIILRNGNSGDFVPSKMRRAEVSVLNDTRKIHVGMGDGTTEELVTKGVVEDAIKNEVDNIINDITTVVNNATTNANTQGNYAKAQGDYAKTQGDYAKQQGDSVRDSVAPIINTNLQASYNDKASGLIGESIVCNVADDGLVNVTRVEGITEQVVTETSPSIEYPSEMKYANNFEIKTVGKNLLPPTTTLTPVTNNGITFTPQSNGSISMNGIATANAEIYLWNNWSSNAPTKFILPRGTYSLNRSPNSNVELFVVSKMTVMMKSSVGVHTLPNDVNVTSCFIRVLSGTQLNNVIIYPQLEQGTVATSYEPYVEDKTTISLPMRSLPNGVKDTIEYVDGESYHIQRVNKFTIDGNVSTSGITEVGDGTVRIWVVLMNFSHVGTEKQLSSMCNKLKHDDSLAINNYPVGNMKHVVRINKDWTGVRAIIRIPSNLLSSIDNAGIKSYFANNPMILLYESPTPIVTPLSDIYLKSYSTTTHLLSTSNPQVRMTADFKSELWSRDYSQDVLLSSTVNKNTEQDLEIAKKFNKSDIVSSDTINDANKVPSSVVTNALGKEIDFLTEKTQKIYNYASGLPWYTQNMSTTEFFNAMPSFMEVTFMVNASSPISDLPQAIGIITIIKGVNNNHGTCEYTSSVSNAIETYVANFSYVGFSGWRKILHESNKGELLHGLYTTAIPSTSDLNNYSTIGEYYCASTDVALTILNTPHTTSGFKLTVEYLSASAHIMQTIKAVNGGGVYYRYANSNNGWNFGNWVSVFGRERSVTMNATYLTNLYTSTEYNPLQSKVGKTVHVNGNFNVHTVVPVTDASAPTTLLSGLYGAYRHRWVPITRMQNGATYWLYLTSSSSDTGSILRSSTELPIGNYYIDISYIAN